MVFLSFDFSNTTVFVPMWISLGPGPGPPPFFFLTSLGQDQGPPPCATCFSYGSYAALTQTFEMGV